jgi:nuclear pore complex protein Nup62
MGLLGSTKPAGTQAATPAQDSKSNTTSGFSASTTGPPSQLPRLKNKTMDEIITRWATDLSKYQKEFKDQASKIAEWDRLLVENGEKIQKLYTSTYEAERASSEIERQLSNVESQQEELTAWLDRYESDLNELYAKQGGGNEQVAGPDQERERTYKLAEKLTDRLDDMTKDLTKMIKEINDMSGTLSKGSKPDDPVCFHFFSVVNELRYANTGYVSANPDCACLERPSGPATMDRQQRCRAPGQGCGRAEGERQHGHQRLERRDRCGRELLPVLPERVQMKEWGSLEAKRDWEGDHNVMVRGWDSACMFKRQHRAKRARWTH